MKNRRFIVLLVVMALLALACNGAAPTETTAVDTTEAMDTTTTAGDTTTTAGDTTTTAAEAFEGEPVKAGLVTDLAGVDDRSFNASAWQGVQEAMDAGYATDDSFFLESDERADYQPNIDQLIAQGSEHIVTVGFELGEATQTNAEANPDILWTIVDFSYDPDIENVRELVYQTDEAAFLAGYLAAGMTQSGILGTYGGLNIPTVSIFMDGFARGVEHYNAEKGTSVEVRGWDIDAQDGLFTGSFTDMGLARTTCESLLDEGADIILPVGGAINLPCGDAIVDRGVEAALVGVDQDAFNAMPSQYQDLWMTTIEKGITIQVSRSIQDHAEGNWTPGGVLGTLENGALGLSPYHAWEDRIPEELKSEVEQLRQDIIDGTIDASFTPVG